MYQIVVLTTGVVVPGAVYLLVPAGGTVSPFTQAKVAVAYLPKPPTPVVVSTRNTKAA